MRRRDEKHGYARRGGQTAEYRAWAGMIRRCTNKNEKAYASYGGRGISVCDRWQKSFISFLEDMGHKPNKKYSLDRINNDGNYEPSNCRWATRKEQNRNRRGLQIILYNGKEMTISEAAEIVGLDKDLIYDRLKCGWLLDRALSVKKLPIFGGIGVERFSHKENKNVKKAASP